MSAAALRRPLLAHPVLRRSETVIALVLLAAMLGIGLVNPAFWQPANLFGLLRSNVVIGIMALGVLTVLISGGIDVSFPAFAVAGMYLTVRAMLDWGFSSVLLALLMATAIGAALGVVNALFVHGLRMIPLIVTLGTGGMVRGFLLGVVGTSVVNINRMPPALVEFGRAELLTFEQPDGTRFGLSAAGAAPVFVDILYPVAALKPHAATLTGKVLDKAEPDPAWRQGLTRSVMAVRFPVRSVLAEPVVMPNAWRPSMSTSGVPPVNGVPCRMSWPVLSRPHSSRQAGSWVGSASR